MTAPPDQSLAHQPVELRRVRAVLFDMDGVLYRGAVALPGVNELLEFLARHGVAYACITNNTSRTPVQFSDKLAGLGIAIPAERVVTSATATSIWLREREPRGTTIYPIGMDGLRQALFDDGYFVEQADRPQYVVVGGDFEITYTKLAAACLAIRAGAAFVGTNPDTTFPSEQGLIPGAGALIAALEAATEQKAMIIGKPERAMFDAALRLLGVPAAEALVVGDRLDTDILGAQRAGVPSLLVLTGVSSATEAASGPIRPDAVATGLPELRTAWEDAVRAG